MNNLIHELIQIDKEKETNVIVVSKKRNVENIEKVCNFGFDKFAENRVDELKRKVEILKGQNIEWHFIGNIQSKEIYNIVKYSSVAHSVHRLKEIKLLNQNAKKLNKEYKCFLQVNVSGEISKSGIPCKNWNNNQKLFKDLSVHVKEILDSENLSFMGLMTMAPFSANEGELKTIFSDCHNLLHEIKSKIEGLQGNLFLSMGMSRDYRIAINEGSNYVRLGSLIFDTICK